jgi:hypothetical protein
MSRAQEDPRWDELRAMREALLALELWQRGESRQAILLVRESPLLLHLPESHPAMALLARNSALIAAARGDVAHATRCVGRALAERLRERLAEPSAPPRRVWRGLRLPWERTLVFVAAPR